MILLKSAITLPVPNIARSVPTWIPMMRWARVKDAIAVRMTQDMSHIERHGGSDSNTNNGKNQ